MARAACMDRAILIFENSRCSGLIILGRFQPSQNFSSLSRWISIR